VLNQPGRSLIRFFVLLIFAGFTVAGFPAWAQSPELVVETEAELSTSSAEQAAALLAELDETEARVEELQGVLAEMQGASRRLQIRQIQSEELRGGNVAHALAELVIAADADADSLGEARQQLITIMVAGPEGIQEALDEREALLEERRTERDSATPEAAVDLQDRVSAAGRAVDDVYVFYTRHIKLMNKLGLDESQARDSLIKQMRTRSDRMVAFASLSQEEVQTLDERLKLDPGDAAAKARLTLIKARRKDATGTLRLMIDQLQKLGADTVEYQKQLVKMTGDVSDIGLDTKVAAGLLVEGVGAVQQWLRRDAVTLLVRAAILFATLFFAWFLARLTAGLVGRALHVRRAGMSRLLRSMLAGVAANIVLIIGVLFALTQLGISIGQMLAGVGIAGFIVGFALQDTLSNFASGVMILIYKPFDEGDVIEACGVSGMVQTMSLVSTVILTFDNQTLIVPNNKIWGDVIRNVTHQKTRRVDLVVRVGHEDDLDVAEAVLKDVVLSDERILAEPEPNIRLHELSDSSYDFIVRPWVKTEDYWGVYWDLTREIQRRLAAAGLKTPRPQRDIYYHGEMAEAADTIERP
jgi:small conductance mechanosensitive channel